MEAFKQWIGSQMKDVHVKRVLALEDGDVREMEDCDLVLDTYQIVLNKLEM